MWVSVSRKAHVTRDGDCQQKQVALRLVGTHRFPGVSRAKRQLLLSGENKFTGSQENEMHIQN